MTGKTFFNGVAHDNQDILGRFLSLLEQTETQYCVIGGLAVNAYAEPVVSLDLDVIIAADQIQAVCEQALSIGFSIETFEHSVNLAYAGSDVRIQLQTDARYQSFLSRADIKDVLGYSMRVASLEDVLQGKLWAYSDESRRGSKRQKDLADILRLAETHPDVKRLLPESILKILV
ncbi:MAG TPA: nucleotidyl transferase AbiEii/AbiGii toxin family protein [Candidatus Hydrogenedentes bacterium]|nr:nucleotidyl transferase AbiEii/AbiGii toxin family protein [Candidatus Hydrogenedentota bacterium]